VYLSHWPLVIEQNTSPLLIHELATVTFFDMPLVGDIIFCGYLVEGDLFPKRHHRRLSHYLKVILLSLLMTGKQDSVQVL
jgi:hypothetical protein